MTIRRLYSVFLAFVVAIWGCSNVPWGGGKHAARQGASGVLAVRTTGLPLQTYWLDERRGAWIEESHISDLGAFLPGADEDSLLPDIPLKGSAIERGIVIGQDATHDYVLDHRRPRVVKIPHDQVRALQPEGQLAHAQEVTSVASCPMRQVWESSMNIGPSFFARLQQNGVTPELVSPLPLLARYQRYDVVSFGSETAFISQQCSREVTPLERPMVLVKSGVGGCVLDATSAHGPDAIVTRLNWIDPEIRCVTTDVAQPGDYDRPDPEMRAQEKYLAQSEVVYELQEQVAHAVAESETEGRVVLVLSGAHTTAVGTVTGILRNHPNARVGLIWVDAHPDINTPGSTLSGNPHGMPVAAMTALAYPDDAEWWPKDHPVDPSTRARIDAHWARYRQELMAGQRIAFDDILFVGIRDIDPWEKFIIADRNIAVATVEETHQSRHAVLERAKQVMEGCDVVVLNIDVDSLDAKYATGTGTPVPDGLEPNELYELARLLVNAFADRLAAIEITETDPIMDNGAQIQTLDYAVALTQFVLQGLNVAQR